MAKNLLRSVMTASFRRSEITAGNVTKQPVPAHEAITSSSGGQQLTIPSALTGSGRRGPRALAASFDGAEVHAANGYLLDQFLRDGANQRDDAHGGSPPSRARLLREGTSAVTSIWARSRVCMRISPLSPTNGMSDTDPAATFTQAACDLETLGIAYLHVIEPGVNEP